MVRQATDQEVRTLAPQDYSLWTGTNKMSRLTNVSSLIAGQGGDHVSLLALVTVKRLWTTGKKNAISGKLTCFLDQPRSLKPKLPHN